MGRRGVIGTVPPAGAHSAALGTAEVILYPCLSETAPRLDAVSSDESVVKVMDERGWSGHAQGGITRQRSDHNYGVCDRW